MRSIKVERSDSVNDEVGASTSRRRSGRFTQPAELPKEEEEDERELDEDEFVVERIIARSLSKGDGPWGSEYQYLVRWAGYGPKDDTWEWCSNVATGADDAIVAFSRTEHPFNILDCDVGRSEKRYLVEMCQKHSDPDGLWSPLAERIWLRVQALKTRRGVSSESIRQRIQDWKREQKRSPSPYLEPADSPGKRRKIDYGDAPIGHRMYTRRKLLKILDEQQYRKNGSPWKTRYRVRHQFKTRLKGVQQRDEWYGNEWLLYLFGPEVMRTKLSAYRPESKKVTVKKETLGDGTVLQHDVLSDYEQERLRRIKENEDLIKQLGLA